MFVVFRGRVEVLRRSSRGAGETCLARLGPGSCFGEMSVIDIQPRSATVRTVEASELLVLTNLEFYTLYQKDREAYTLLVMNICREISRRLRRADGIIADFLMRLEDYVKVALE
jgi:CRP-like cAMP-binding protein